MGDENMPRKIKDNFKQVWCQRLITYAEKNHSKHASMLSKMEQAIDSGTLEEGRVLKYSKIMFVYRMSNRGCYIILTLH
jgi:hypothetical protein